MLGWVLGGGLVKSVRFEKMMDHSFLSNPLGWPRIEKVRKGKWRSARGREEERKRERLGSVKNNGEIPRERWISKIGQIGSG